MLTYMFTGPTFTSVPALELVLRLHQRVFWVAWFLPRCAFPQVVARSTTFALLLIKNTVFSSDSNIYPLNLQSLPRKPAYFILCIILGIILYCFSLFALPVP